MCSIVLLVVLGACSDEDKFMGGNDEIVVTAIMPDDGTTPSHGTLKGVAVSSDDNTLNLITKWKSGDKIQVFVRQDNKVYKASEESAVYNISSNGKTCSFNFSLPSSIDGARVYDVIGVTGISAQAADNEVIAISDMIRTNLDSNGEATSPMWFITAKTNTMTNFQAKFQHLGTYEILHVTNATSGDLTFRHLGFDVSEPWFKCVDNTVLNSTYDPTAHFTESGDVASPPILIRAGKTGKILSWYMPSGSLMEGAKLLALINGKNITSSNTKSSALPIERGKAYHMYATWDGKQLKFDDNSHGVAEGLVAYYPFNGNANDESGNGNHGEIRGNVVLTSDRFGNSNSAYKFPGQSFNYISVPDNEILHISSFTLSAWFYTDADNYGSGYLICKGRDIIDGSYRLGVGGVGAETEYGQINGAGIEEIPSVKVWHMATGTVEGDRAKFYLDGNLVAEETLSKPFVYDNSESLTFGMHYYSSVPSYWTYPYLGIIDDIRIYNRVLTQEEIRSLYNE